MWVYKGVLSLWEVEESGQRRSYLTIKNFWKAQVRPAARVHHHHCHCTEYMDVLCVMSCHLFDACYDARIDS